MNRAYDHNGNMSVGTNRMWDVENHLTSITKGGVTTNFVYDGDGNRIKQVVTGSPNVVTLYINKYYEKTDTEVTTSYYLGGQLIAQRKGTTPRKQRQILLMNHGMLVREILLIQKRGG